MKYYFCDCCDHSLDETQLTEEGNCWQCDEKPELTAEFPAEETSDD
jgi:hypothetical protein